MSQIDVPSNLTSKRGSETAQVRKKKKRLSSRQRRATLPRRENPHMRGIFGLHVKENEQNQQRGNSDPPCLSAHPYAAHIGK